jgi:hypothetical protein
LSFGIDFAAKPPTPLALKAHGVTFVCRYLSSPGNLKNITAPEVLTTRAAGIDIVLVFETAAARALSGRAAGEQDARSARAQARLVGLPAAPIFFAVDFDATPREQVKINAYLAGAAYVLGYAKTGVYGGFYVVKRALDSKVCKYAWQTYAWSGGKWDKRAHIQQYRNAQSLAGISVDFDRSMCADYGQTPATTMPDRKRTLRAWILKRRRAGRTWSWLKATANFKTWRRLGGR